VGCSAVQAMLQGTVLCLGTSQHGAIETRGLSFTANMYTLAMPTFHSRPSEPSALFTLQQVMSRISDLVSLPLRRVPKSPMRS
jgi:hypothetical protein